MPGLGAAEECANAVEGDAGLFVECLLCPDMKDEAVDPQGEIVVAQRFEVVGVNVPSDRVLSECFRADDSFAIDVACTDSVADVVGFVLIDAVEPEFTHGHVRFKPT